MSRHKEFDRTKALEKAMRLFWHQGYEATSITDLCEAMGINRGSLYDTYGSKHALYMEALHRYLALNTLSPKTDDTASGLEMIEAIFNSLVEASASDASRRGCFVANTIAELSAHDPEIAKLCAANRDNYETMFHGLLRQAQEQGEIAPHRELRPLARFLVNTVYGLRLTAKTTTDAAYLSDIVQAALTALR